ncbi:MAG: radical SAM protein [Syntrophomonadaceae bacterium]|nr:radical SAM protein [Syntrophomonadaceae bacterium]
MKQRLVVKEIKCRSALNRTGIPGYEFCLNPYSGCAHRCLYCYADFTRRFTRHDQPWGEYVDVKVNFPEVLRKQLGGRKKPAGRVILGTVTDPYQPLESSYHITRTSLEVLAGFPNLEVDLLTKSGLVTRDIEMLQRLTGCSVGITINLLNDAMARVLEPEATPPSGRLAAAKEMVEGGLSVWVFIAPLLPGLGDRPEALSQLLAGIKQAGVKAVEVDFFNPYPSAVKRLRRVYQSFFPWALRSLEWFLADPLEYRLQVSATLQKYSEVYSFNLVPG